MLLPRIAALSLLLKSAFCVFADEAWSTDYHYALLGQPIQDTTFFHQPNPTSKASLLYTLSEKGVLGAINPKDGAIVWRQLLQHNTSATSRGSLRGSEGQDVVVSGLGRSVTAWSSSDGRLVWSVEQDGLVEDVEILELGDKLAKPGVKDVITLASGDAPTVERMDGASGSSRWKYKVEGSDIPYQVSASSTEIFVILLHKTILGYYKIRVITLDTVDGHKTDEYTLSSESELAATDTIISVGANSASPIIAWTDASYSVLKVNIIGTKGISSFNIEKHGEAAVSSVKLHAPYHANSLAHFLVHYETSTSHWAEVFHINLNKNKVEKAYSLPKVAGKGSFSTSVSDANVYFTRMTEEEITTVSSASHGILGRWPVRSLDTAVGASDSATPIHAASELSVKGDTVSAIRTAVLLSTGDWVLLRDGTPLWMRPEALASIESATFATSSAVEELAQQLDVEAHSNPISAYVHRMKRHISELKYLPGALAQLPQWFLKGFLGTTAEGGPDIFGFHQIIACATSAGRLVALDAGDANRILWSRQVTDVKPGEVWVPKLSSRADVLVLDLPDTVEQRAFNATNGEPLAAIPVGDDVPHVPAVQFSITDRGVDAKRMDSVHGGVVWNFASAADERIVALIPRPINDPVASIGKVLGDRRVLYKYLDQNLALLVTANDAKRAANFYVLDTISGSMIFSNSHSNVDINAPIASVMSENWFAYSYTADTTSSSPVKGHQLVVGEMFESLVPNDRGSLHSTSNFTSLQTSTQPFTLTATYQIPESISKLAVTQTKQGITSRQLLAVLDDSNALIGIPYGVLDPRRPVGRDPTKDEQAEGLVRYAPVIEFDPKWYLNHAREVVGVENIITSPALIESTSLVFAYGLDVFGTRLSPSFSFDILGKDFNKFQMLATVAALGVATFVVAPLVMRKQVNTRWQFA